MQATPLGLAEGEGEMFAEIDQMINVHEDAPSDMDGDGYSEADDERHNDMLIGQ